jgi:hypothetical protein
MQIISSYNEDDSKMVGAFGSGNSDATWRVIATISFNEKEPDWRTIDG